MTSPSTSNLPRVSVGMPIYNGAKTLAVAIESLINQTCRDIEIIISDNGSMDDTAAICQKYAATDSRIRYFRQDRTISPTRNFNFVLDQARAEFFMWAAHDDSRDSDYIEKLLDGLEQNPDAVLSFGDIMQYTNGVPKPMTIDFVTKNKSFAERMHWIAVSPLHHLYGLWRVSALRKIKWKHVDWWHDTPLMMAAATLGEFVYVPGVNFHYTNNQHPFFYWKGRPGAHGMIIVGKYLKRVRDLFLLVWLSMTTVGHVAGIRMGALAGLYSCVKIAQQTKTFIQQRI